MPERKKATAARKTAAKKTPPKKAAASKEATATVAEAPKPAADVCPRCGTAKFGHEDRIRAEGNRTVRYTVLVCERGHTFARPVARPS